MAKLSRIGILLVLTATAAHAEWIDPPSRPFKVQAALNVPYADFSLHNANEQVTYRMTPSLVPTLTFGYRFINFSISKKFFSESGPLASKYGASYFSSFRFGLNFKYVVIDFALDKYHGLHTGVTDGNLYRPDLRYLMAGFNGYGGISIDGDIPYSVQAYYGSVEVPKGFEFDFDAFSNLNWNSLSASSAIVPTEKSAAFGEVAELKGFKSMAFNAGIGVGATYPLAQHWLVSAMAAIGLSFTGGSQVYTSDNNYSFDVGNQYFGRFALLYRRENHTWALKAYFDRWTQSVKSVDFRDDLKGGSISYSFRF